MEYYYAEGTQQQGPVTEEQLVEMIETKQISAMTKIWCEEYESWIEFSASPMAQCVSQGGAPAVPVQANHHNIQPQIAQQGCYCRSCGNAVMPDAQVCMSCGTPPQLGSNFCPTCASPTNPQQVMCVKCGVPLCSALLCTAVKSKAIAVLLAFFLGTLGAHNFYLGDNIKGGSKAGLVIIAILMAVANSADGDCNPLFGLINLGVIIWVFVEVFMILSGKMKDAKGNPLKE